MITYNYSSSADRQHLSELLRELNVIDVGGAYSCLPHRVTAVVDFNEPAFNCKQFFRGNINLPEVWQQVHDFVKINGKFDYAICTHTLEDISNPYYVCREIEKIAQMGCIIVPSKFKEFGRFGNHYRGFIHHRWIFEVIDGVFTGFPKINYIEHPKFDMTETSKDELIIYWKDKIGLEIVNNDFLGPDNQSVESYYDKLIQ